MARQRGQRETVLAPVVAAEQQLASVERDAHLGPSAASVASVLGCELHCASLNRDRCGLTMCGHDRGSGVSLRATP